MRFSIGEDCAAAAEDVAMAENDRCRSVMVANGFKPEIASRISYFFQYRALDREDIKQILLLSFKNKALEDGVKVARISRDLQEELFAQFGTSSFGVRPLEYALDSVLGAQVPDVGGVEKEYNVDGTLSRLHFEEVCHEETGL